MGGGWSQVDTFRSEARAREVRRRADRRKVQGDVIVRQGFPRPLMPSPLRSRSAGRAGVEIAELFRILSAHVDQIAFLRSVYGRSNDHVQGTYEMQTGRSISASPSVGSCHVRLGSVASSFPRTS